MYFLTTCCSSNIIPEISVVHMILKKINTITQRMITASIKMKVNEAVVISRSCNKHS